MFNEVAQAKFVHTVSAGYVTAAVFVIGVSAWYLLKDRHHALAKRSITVAASFGLASALSVAVLGDESGYAATHTQKMKLAAIEGMWETHEAPAPFTIVGLPDQEAQETHFAIEVPVVMGLIGTRSLTAEIPGIKELQAISEERIRSGLFAYDALMTIRADRAATSDAVRAQFDAHREDLGYALLLKRYVDDPREATDAMIAQAVADTTPTVWPLFWSFRLMVGLGVLFIVSMAFFFWRCSFRGGTFPRWSLIAAVAMIPTPWIAAEAGWVVAEYGRQPWTASCRRPCRSAISPSPNC